MKNEPQMSCSGGQLEEEKIEWLSDPHSYPYLRESSIKCKRREGFPSHKLNDKKNKLIGYAILKKDAPSKLSGVFYRRYWYFVESNDPFDNALPSQAVLPDSIKVGVDSLENNY